MDQPTHCRRRGSGEHIPSSSDNLPHLGISCGTDFIEHHKSGFNLERMEQKEKREGRKANALINVVQSRKYFLAFFVTALNCIWHYRPMVMAVEFTESLQVAQQFMTWEIAAIGLYYGVNQAGKHRAFHQHQEMDEL